MLAIPRHGKVYELIEGSDSNPSIKNRLEFDSIRKDIGKKSEIMFLKPKNSSWQPHRKDRL